VELLRDGFTPTSTRRNFSAGGTVQLGRVETHMAALPAAPSSSVGSAARTATPAAAPESPKPDPVSPELADWQRVSKNPTAGELEEFLQKYPSGSNAAEAQRALERLDWSATNKSNWVSLQAYLAKHPSGPNAAQAAVEIARIDRDATARQQVQQDAERLRAERDEIRALLRSYGEAYTHKDANQIAALWPSMPARNLRDIRASFRDFQTLKLELRPLSEPEIAGASARVACRRVTDAVDRNGSHPTEGTVTVQFAKQNGRWVIDAIQ
jgi:hypothetical protein